MNKEKVIKELKEKYPEANLFLNNEDNPTEIVAEIEPKNGKAIAVIDKSISHVHNHTEERYVIIKGDLELFIDGERRCLKEGDIFDIRPGQVHYAVGNETWVEAISNPPWSPEDHIIAENEEQK